MRMQRPVPDTFAICALLHIGHAHGGAGGRRGRRGGAVALAARVVAAHREVEDDEEPVVDGLLPAASCSGGYRGTSTVLTCRGQPPETSRPASLTRARARRSPDERR